MIDRLKQDRATTLGLIGAATVAYSVLSEEDSGVAPEGAPA